MQGRSGDDSGDGMETRGVTVRVMGVKFTVAGEHACRERVHACLTTGIGVVGWRAVGGAGCVGCDARMREQAACASNLRGHTVSMVHCRWMRSSIRMQGLGPRHVVVHRPSPWAGGLWLER